MPPRTVLLCLVAAVASMAQQAHFFNMSDAGLNYDDSITAFAYQGLFNKQRANNSKGLLFFDIGAQNYDWPHADEYWMKTLNMSFSSVKPDLCSLVTHDATREQWIAGLVIYEGDRLGEKFGDGYSAAIALTLAGQRSLLPISAASLAKHSCLKGIQANVDLREELDGKTRKEAWLWAIEHLLPQSSKKVVFNLNHYRVQDDPIGFKHDKQSEATASSIDYIVQQNAFVLDLESHASVGTSTAPWDDDDELIQTVFSQLDPLFDAYGWADDEFSWTNETSHYGGTIMCSFASPNLSFWAMLQIASGAKRARKLPSNDRGIKLDKSKYYVTFETNEGDTPRILVSAMASAWPQPERGSFPVAWAIDPLLAERFPALFDYYAATATQNDSFIAGTAGAGYAFLNQMSAEQLQAYGRRVGSLTAMYGPHVIDTYGYANLSVHEAYAQAASSVQGGTPAAFVTQPNWAQTAYDPYRCEKENQLLSDGTPLICTSGDPKLFYYSSHLDAACPSCDLSQRITAAAKKQPPPHFVTVYGGLQAFGGSEKKSKKNFFTLLGDTIGKLAAMAGHALQYAREAALTQLHEDSKKDPADLAEEAHGLRPRRRLHNTQAYRAIDIIFDADLKTTMAIFCLNEIAKPTKEECESASAAEVRTWIA